MEYNSIISRAGKGWITEALLLLSKSCLLVAILDVEKGRFIYL